MFDPMTIVGKELNVKVPGNPIHSQELLVDPRSLWRMRHLMQNLYQKCMKLVYDWTRSRNQKLKISMQLTSKNKEKGFFKDERDQKKKQVL